MCFVAETSSWEEPKSVMHNFLCVVWRNPLPITGSVILFKISFRCIVVEGLLEARVSWMQCRQGISPPLGGTLVQAQIGKACAY